MERQTEASSQTVRWRQPDGTKTNRKTITTVQQSGRKIIHTGAHTYTYARTRRDTQESSTRPTQQDVHL